MNGKNNQTKPVGWSSLPAELRIQILETVISEKQPGWSSCVIICKEWQPIFEKENFHRLNLIVPAKNGNLSSLDNFKHHVDRAQRYVQHIYMCVELPSKNCRAMDCGGVSTDSRPSNDVQWALGKFFNILSTWEQRPGRGLTLDLNVLPPATLSTGSRLTSSTLAHKTTKTRV